MDELSGAVENCFDGRWEKWGASLEPTEGAGTLLGSGGTRSLMIEGCLLNNISTGYVHPSQSLQPDRGNSNICPKKEIKQSKSPTHLISILLVFDSSPKSEESGL